MIRYTPERRGASRDTRAGRYSLRQRKVERELAEAAPSWLIVERGAEVSLYLDDLKVEADPLSRFIHHPHVAVEGVISRGRGFGYTIDTCSTGRISVWLCSGPCSYQVITVPS